MEASVTTVPATTPLPTPTPPPPIKARSRATPRLCEARGEHEDWTGLKDAKARRKLQTRLNVRAHHSLAVSPELLLYYSRAAATGQWPHPGSSKDAALMLSRLWRLPGLQRFVHGAAFAMSSDHLIPLTQYNILRATLTNMTLLSATDAAATHRGDHSGDQRLPAPDRHDVWRAVPLFPPPASPPDTLAATELQRRVPHEVWLDFLPDARLRDNSIVQAGRFRWQDACHDLVGSLCADAWTTADMTGMLVWADPWRPEGWEVSEGFVRKWGFLLSGCDRLLRSTNRWRRERGEEPLADELEAYFRE